MIIMGVFDLFGRDSKSKSQRDMVDFSLPQSADERSKRGPVSVFSPTSYDDVQIIIDTVKMGKTAIVHLKELKSDTAIRVLDMLSGAIYALDGGVYEMEKNIFMFSPNGVEVR